MEDFNRSTVEEIQGENEIFDIPSWLAILLTIVYLTVSLCAILGNWMVLWIVARSPVMRNVTNLFIANLASADIIIGAFAIPFQFQAALLQKWLLPNFMCSFCPTVQVVSLNLSIFTLVALSIDRHQAITQPFKPRLTKKAGIVIIFFIWIISVTTAVPTFMAFTVVMQEASRSTSNDSQLDLVPVCAPYGLEQDFVLMYNHLLVCLQYVVPIIIISIAYIHMAIVLSRGPGIRNETRNDADRIMQSKKRVIKMLFIVISIFTICWLPFQMYNILQEIYPSINSYKYINVIWFCCHLFAMSNSCYNPFIYALYGVSIVLKFAKNNLISFSFSRKSSMLSLENDFICVAFGSTRELTRQEVTGMKIEIQMPLD